MGTIKAGWELAIVNPDGEIVHTLYLQGYNLDKSLARDDVATDIHETVEFHGGYEN